VIPNFRQQIKNRGDGIIGGHIQIKASKIIIETKLHGLTQPHFNSSTNSVERTISLNS
jgi:hypothetical protein